LYLVRADEIIGALALEDEVRPEARRAVDDLHQIGIERVVMMATLEHYGRHKERTAAALGFSKANAGRGRWGGWLADVTLRMLRLASRAVRPVGRVRYFENYCRLVLEARALEQRLGDALSPAERAALRRIQGCDGTVGGAAWFALRTLRPLVGRNETMGMERGLLAGLLWRLLAGLRARVARVRSSA